MQSPDPLPASAKLRFPEVLLLGCIMALPLVTYTELLDYRLISRGLYLALMLVLGYGYYVLVPPAIGSMNRGWSAKALFPFAVILIGYVVASFAALNVVEAQYWIVKGVFWLLFVMLMLIMRLQGSLTLARVSIAIAGAVLVAWVVFVVEWFQGDAETRSLLALSTPFGHKNLYASFLVLALPFVLYMWSLSHKRALRLLVVGLVAGILGTIVLLQAKTALVALVAAALFLFLLMLKRFSPATRRWFVLAILLVLLSGFAILLHFDGTLYTLRTGSWDERLLVWQNSLFLIKDHPVWGVGGGNWQILFPQYGMHHFFGLNDTVYQGYETFQRPHNDYLWVYSEAGIIGFIGWIGFLIIPLWRFFTSKQYQLEALHPNNLMLAGLMAYFVIALSDFSIERFEHQMLMALLFLFSLCSTNDPESKETTAPTSRTIPVTGLLLSILVTIVFFARLNAERNHQKVLQAHAAGQYQKMIELAPKTNTAVYNIDNFSIPVKWYEGVARSALGEQRTALALFREAHAINPWQVHVLNNLAGACQQTGATDLAMKYYRQALAIAPLHYEVLLNKSITEYNLGQVDSAFATLLQLYYKPEHAPAYHQAMPVIFNAWLNQLKTDSASGIWNQQSIQNLLMSDSLKRNFLYHVQIEKQEVVKLVNTF